MSEMVLEKDAIQQLSSRGRFEDMWDIVKDAEDFLGYRIEIRLVKEAVGYSGYVAQLRGVASEGDDAESAMRNVLEAFQLCIETYAQESMPIPWSEPEPKQDGESAFPVMVAK